MGWAGRADASECLGPLSPFRRPRRFRLVGLLGAGDREPSARHSSSRKRRTRPLARPLARDNKPPTPARPARAQSPPDWAEILTYFRGSELQNYFQKILVGGRRKRKFGFFLENMLSVKPLSCGLENTLPLLGQPPLSLSLSVAATSRRSWWAGAGKKTGFFPGTHALWG